MGQVESALQGLGGREGHQHDVPTGSKWLQMLLQGAVAGVRGGVGEVDSGMRVSGGKGRELGVMACLPKNSGGQQRGAELSVPTKGRGWVGWGGEGARGEELAQGKRAALRQDTHQVAIPRVPGQDGTVAHERHQAAGGDRSPQELLVLHRIHVGVHLAHGRAVGGGARWCVRCGCARQRGCAWARGLGGGSARGTEEGDGEREDTMYIEWQCAVRGK